MTLRPYQLALVDGILRNPDCRVVVEKTRRPLRVSTPGMFAALRALALLDAMRTNPIPRRGTVTDARVSDMSNRQLLLWEKAQRRYERHGRRNQR